MCCGRQLSFVDFVIGISGFQRHPIEGIIDSWIWFDRSERAKLTGRTSFSTQPGRLLTCRPRFLGNHLVAGLYRISEQILIVGLWIRFPAGSSSPSELLLVLLPPLL